MEEMDIIDVDNQFDNRNYYQKKKLPNSVAVLVLGIVSLVICQIGFITGTIAIVLASSDRKLLANNPNAYSEGSIKNLNAGRVCAIIGVSLSVVVILFYVIFFGLMISNVKDGVEHFPNEIFEEIKRNKNSNLRLIF